MGRTEDRRFAALLRAHRVAAGLSQEALAERAQLSRRTVSNLERGATAAPYGQTVALLAEALALTESDRAELEGAVHRARTPVSSEPGGAAGAQHPVPADGDPLLATKLEIPPARSTLIPRPQLMERLQRGVRGPLTLLSAPPGSGKTTLLSAWSNQHTAPIAWVSLDEDDNDPSRFWRYVLTALDRAIPGAGSAALAAVDATNPPLEAALTALVNALAAQAGDIVLILDDYHLIEAEPIHRLLGFLLEHLPPCLHILLATRADPPLPLARLRARGEVTELRAADLRFTEEETAAFLMTVMGLSLPAIEVNALEARTEGWIAGLQLAGLSLQGRSAEDRAAFIADFTGSHRYVVDYLLDEVLLRQPEEVQRFLLHTCILDRLCAPLCAAVLEGDDPPAERIVACQQILESLERNNVFLTALDDERRWYRYHHLFADALCQRHGSQAWIPDVAGLHRRASAWFEQQGLVGEAISHALAGGSYDTAADLIPRSLRPIISRGKVQGLAAWYRALPEATFQARPDLAIGHAWILLDFRDLERAEQQLSYAETALATRAELYAAEYRERLQAVIESTRAVIDVMHGSADRAIARALTVLGDVAALDARIHSINRADVIEVRSAGSFALGLAHLSKGAVKEAADVFGRVAAENRGTPHTSVFLVLATAGEASAQRMAGELDLARAAYERAITWSEAFSPTPLRAGSHYTGLADVLRERNELDAALQRATYGLGLEPSLATAGAERWVEWNACNLLVLSRVKQAQGDADGALDDVHEAQEQLKRFGAITIAAILAAFEAQLHLAQGNLDAAVRWLRSAEAQPAPPRFGVTPQVFVYASEHLEIAPVQVLIAQGRASGDPALIHRALVLLARLQGKAERLGLVWLRTKALVLEALALQVLGDLPAALSALDRALLLAEPSRSMRLFLDEGVPMAGLLRERRARGARLDHASALLDALAGHQERDLHGAARPGAAETRGRDLAERLTDRELDVLRLLAAGWSTPKIARTLYVEVNTVRTHVKHLYGKLGVHSRDQVVWRARELGLL